MNKYFKQFNAIRLVRLIMGASLAIAAYFSGHYIFIGIGVWFVIQGLLNLSCCGTTQCSTNETTQNTVYKDNIKDYKNE